MGDRANIYLEMPTYDGKAWGVGGVYLYTHSTGYRWPEELRKALKFGRGRWTDDQYLARIITSRVFADLVDSETGGGLSLVLGDNSHPIIIADLVKGTVSFAEEGDEQDRDKRYGEMSFEAYVAQERADYREQKDEPPAEPEITPFIVSPDKLEVQRREQHDGTPSFDLGGGMVAMLTPKVGEDYWSYRVVLSERQAVVAFPKFGTIGIGFAVEDDDWNTNLPYSCETGEIVKHILKNKGDDRIADEAVTEAVKLLQDAIAADKA